MAQGTLTKTDNENRTHVWTDDEKEALTIAIREHAQAPSALLGAFRVLCPTSLRTDDAIARRVIDLDKALGVAIGQVLRERVSARVKRPGRRKNEAQNGAYSTPPNTSTADPIALIRYIVMGVRIGVHTAEEAISKIEKVLS